MVNFGWNEREGNSIFPFYFVFRSGMWCFAGNMSHTENIYLYLYISIYIYISIYLYVYISIYTYKRSVFGAKLLEDLESL